MDITQLIAARTAARDALQARFDALDKEGRSILDAAAADNKRALTDQENARSLEIVEERSKLRSQISEANDQLGRLDAERAADEKATRDAEVRKPGADAPDGGTQAARTNDRDTVYSRDKSGKGVSFFRDMLAAQTGMPSQAVQERLLKHEQETQQRVRDGKLSERAIATTGLGGLVPPQYLADQYAAIARAGRPTANLVTQLQLPESGMSIVIPRGTTGVATGVQATQNSNVQNQDAAVTDITVPIVTIAGQVDPSRQSIERGVQVDEILYADLAAAYAVNVDVEVLSGTGTGGRALGILNTAGITQASAFTAAATIATFYSKVAGGINSVQTGRFLPPEAIVMHPRRWAWLTAQFDSSGRPLVLPTTNGPINVVGVTEGELSSVTTVTPSGELQALPVITDASVPTAVGTGPEDQVIISRFSDHLLWEDGNGAPTQLRFEQTLGNQLTVKLVAYGYIGFTAARFPAATTVIGGNAGAGFGLVAPTF